MLRALPIPSLLRAAVLLTALGALGLSGCGDDPKKFTVIVTSDTDSLFRDGSDTATLTVTILSDAGQPPEIGSSFTVVPALGGTLGDGSQFGTFQTDLTGSGTAPVRCNDTNDFLVVSVIFEEESGDLIIPCGPPPTGDWIVSSTGSAPDPIDAGDQGQLFFRATTRDGAPVPVGTRIEVEILGGNVVLANGSTSAVVTTRSGDGSISVPVRAPEDLQTSTVCASFFDTRLGRSEGCAIIGRAARSCIGVFNPESVPADGATTASLTFAVVDSLGTPVPGARVDVEITDDGDDAATLVEDADGAAPSSSKALETGTDGRAEIFVRAGTVSGSASYVATATFTDVNNDTGEQEAVNIACELSNDLLFEPVPECFFEPIEIIGGGDRLGTANSPFPKSATVTACFRDIGGEPVGGGQRVRFEIPVGPAGYTANPGNTLTGANGCASSRVLTGQSAGQFHVRASLGEGAFASSCTSATIEVQSGRPVTQGWSMLPGTLNVGALLGPSVDLVRNYCEVPFQTDLVDLRGNRVDADFFPISFLAEQGALSDAVSAGSENGTMSFTHQINGELPYQAGAAAPGELCDAGTFCQTDGLVSMIAYTDGEEFFCDSIQNGVRDEGEAFEDLSEPYVDIDENGVYDEGRDLFIDIVTPTRERNGTWDRPNGEWDSETKIFVAGHLLYTGPLSFLRQAGGVPGPLSINLSGNTGQANFEMLDGFLNPVAGTITQVSQNITCEDAEGDNSLNIELLAADSLPFVVRRERTHFNAAGEPLDGLGPTESCTDSRVARWETRYVVDYNSSTGSAPRIAIEYDRETALYRCEGTIEVEQSIASGCDGITVRTVIPFAWR